MKPGYLWRKFTALPSHPLLWGLYPLLALYLANIDEIPFFAVSRSLVFSLAITTLAFLIIYCLLILPRSIPDFKTALLLVILTAALTGAYIGLHILLKNNASSVRHRLLLPVWVFGLLALIIWLVKPARLLEAMRQPAALEKAAAITSLFLVLFFSYGHLSGWLSEGSGYKRIMDIHQRLLAVWGLVLLAGMAYILWVRKTTGLTKALNTLSVILLLVVLAQIGLHSLQQAGKPGRQNTSVQTTLASDDRDVYYIILDSYGREDLLRENASLDITSFVQEMTEMGFVFPACTQGNYPTTVLSITSSLNMDYLEALPLDLNSRNQTPSDFESLIKHSRVRKAFEEMGYATVTYNVVNPYLNITDSTYYYDLFANEESAQRVETLNFYYLYLKTTALRPVLDHFERKPLDIPSLPPAILNWLPTKQAFSDRYYKQYQQNTYLLDSLENVPELPGKKFIFAHLFVTHEPFVFTPEGKYRWPVGGDAAAYRDQVLFTNKRLPEIMRTILAKSKKPPVIVIQGDHGWVWGEKRVRILNAYYLPNGGQEQLYPEITPVNTFRIILNQYFEGDFNLLPDISYYPVSEAPYQFKEVPGSCIEP